MITSKSNAIEADCRSLLVYVKLLYDRIVWTFEGFHLRMQLSINSRCYVWRF